ncbi:Protein CBG26627 [Caenorhabditis briggsae]|uniref:Protein CBG26627 n=1 Tax=Caenorhabditis briggsae TaxID=6238 RepID=B6ILJ7_CAEBR|nr:Protein CBG26627 [Caenorhabditis briggsae]CAS00777.1 Protein CBG26627 [Caenorhabditis briggsae]
MSSGSSIMYHCQKTGCISGFTQKKDMIDHIFINHIKHWKARMGKENEVVVREKKARNGEKTLPKGISCFWKRCDSCFTNRKDMEQHVISSHFELDDVEWVMEDEEEEKASEILDHSETSGSQEPLEERNLRIPDSGEDTLNNAPEYAKPESLLSRILKSEQRLVRRLQDAEFNDTDCTVANPRPQKRMRLDYDLPGSSDAPEYEDEMPDELWPPKMPAMKKPKRQSSADSDSTSSEVQCSSSTTTKIKKYRMRTSRRPLTTWKRPAPSAQEYKNSDGEDDEMPMSRRITRSQKAWPGVPIGSRRITRSQNPWKEKKAKRNSVSGQNEVNNGLLLF